jgi:hypothetical protein
MLKNMARVAHHMIRHFHEVTPAIVAELGHMNVLMVCAIMGALVVVFAYQVYAEGMAVEVV